MADNVNIEAKLCSYVEGDLDAAGRAEIERYLEANPQYRPILEELVRTRGELRALPRVKAPVDLQENLSGQLERSALLGDQDLLREVARRPRFPHARAWAAVLLLTSALAAVVYSVLPARKAQMSELANLTTAPVDTDFAATAPASNVADAAADKTVAAMAATPPLPQPVTPPATEIANAKAVLADTTLEPSSATMSSPNSNAIAQSVIVPAADLPAAEAQVHAYLTAQNYAFGSTSAPDVEKERSPSPVLNNSSRSLSAGPLGKPAVRMIVVHQLTDSQVHETRMALASLNSFAPVLGSQNAGTFASVANGIGGAALATTQPTSMPATDADLVPGQSIHVTAEDTGLGGVAAMDENLNIDPDGTITLPLLGKVRAAGMPPAALARSIELDYEIAKSPTRAKWTIRLLPMRNDASMTRHTMTASADMQNIPTTDSAIASLPIASPPAELSSTRPTTAFAASVSEQADRRGEAMADLLPSNSTENNSASATTHPATNTAATSSPSEARNDLTIVLVGTTPATAPATQPDSDSIYPSTVPTPLAPASTLPSSGSRGPTTSASSSRVLP